MLPFSIHSQLYLVRLTDHLQVCEVSNYPRQALATPPAHPPSVALAPVFDGSLFMAASRSAQVTTIRPSSMHMLKGLKDWMKIGTSAVALNMTPTFNSALCIIEKPIAQQLSAIIADTVGRVVAVRLGGLQDCFIILYRGLLRSTDGRSISAGNLFLQCCLRAACLPCLCNTWLLKGSVVPGLPHVTCQGSVNLVKGFGRVSIPRCGVG